MNRKGTLVVSLAVMAVLAVLVATASAAQQDGPKLMIREKEVELGTFYEGSDIDYSFVLRNTGVSPLHILSVRPG